MSYSTPTQKNGVTDEPQNFKEYSLENESSIMNKGGVLVIRSNSLCES